jgi:hypothetical protein
MSRTDISDEYLGGQVGEMNSIGDDNVIIAVICSLFAGRESEVGVAQRWQQSLDSAPTKKRCRPSATNVDSGYAYTLTDNPFLDKSDGRGHPREWLIGPQAMHVP